MSLPPKKTGLSLYADLLDPNKKVQGTTISGAPVRYDVKKETDEELQKKKDASLKFQPIKRPQVPAKAKPKQTSSSSAHKISSSTITASSPDKQTVGSTPQQQPSVQKSNFEDWVGDDDDDYYYHDRPKHERGGRKKKKKNKAPGQEARTWDWDDIYDPTLPNNYADYKGSDEQYREIRDWKARLYYHQLKEAKKDGRNGSAYSDEEEERPRPANKMFAPPPNLSFAPPSFDDGAPPPPMDDDDDFPDRRPSRNDRGSDDTYAPQPTFAPAVVPDDPTGEDAYMRRMRLSGMAQAQSSPTPPPPPTVVSTVPSTSTPPAATKSDADIEAKRAEAQAKITAFKAKYQKAAPKVDTTPNTTPNAPNPAAESTVSTAQPTSSVAQHPPPPPPPPVDEPGVIVSRAAVRYEAPQSNQTPSADTIMAGNNAPGIAVEAEQPRSTRPGQKGFGERLLKKYGWEKGQGLGAQGEGITTALIGKVDKRKKLSDYEGGGWAQPANMGKIIGGKRRKVDNEDDSRFGKMSEVVKLEGMLNGLDVQREIEENNLMQEIGDEMGSRYGNVERVFIWREAMGGQNEVFVKFTSQLSAMRAVNATDGMEFAGNDVVARYWDAEKFDAGDYA